MRLTPPSNKKAVKKTRAKLRRQAHRPSVVAKVLRYGALVSVVGGIGGLFGWAATSGYLSQKIASAQKEIVQFSAENGLAVDQVLVTGRIRTDRDDLLEAVGVERGMPMFDVDVEALYTRVTGLPWVKSAKINRSFPDRISIALTERTPLALWQREGAFELVDQEGTPIPGQQIEQFTHLPVITGEDAPIEAAGLLDMLAVEPELAKRVRGAARVGGRRWNLVLDNGVTVRLPEIEAARAWTKLAEVDREKQVLNRDITLIDLRFDDRLLLRRANPDADAPAAEDRST